MRIQTDCRRIAVGVVGCILVGSTLGGPVPAMEGNPVIVTLSHSSESQPAAATVHMPVQDTFTWNELAPITLDDRIRYLAVVNDRLQPQPAWHSVQPGDTAWRLAVRFETDLGTIMELNPGLDVVALRPGQRLKVIPGFRGIVHQVQPEERLMDLATRYSISVTDIVAVNLISPEQQLTEGDTILLPGARPRSSRTLVASRGAVPRSASEEAPSAPPKAMVPRPETDLTGWEWPITGGLFSSEFGGRWGGFHSGLDIAVPTGTAAAAARAGTVSFSGWDGGYGYNVIIDHGNGLQTMYAHASSLLVTQGQVVEQGESVILVGSTGNSTGPHLHFEVLVDGKPQNPRHFLPEQS